MSGGHFDYRQYQLDDIADELEKLITENDKKDDYGYARNYPSHVIDEFKQALRAVRRARVYLHNIDYLVSGDTGIESFQMALFKELEELQKKLL